MLRLLCHPSWSPPHAPAQVLPVTVPASLLIVLASRGGWVDREGLAALWWPDAAPAEAFHHLRISLHRARVLAGRWGRADALVAERNRVRLELPCDLRGFEQAVAARDAAALAGVRPPCWLEGWRLPGFGGFAEWAHTEGRRLQAAWADAAPGALAQALRRQDLAAARGLFDAWRADSDAGEPWLPATERAVLAPPALASWDDWAATLRGPAVAASVAERPRPVAGRDAEQQRLIATSAAAVVVLGDPGIGKSTLLDASFPGTPRLQGREGLQSLPYRPLLDALRAQLGPLLAALADPSHELAAYRLDLARVLPEVAPAQAVPALDAVIARTRLTHGLALAAEALATQWRVDDLQWCDAATLEWLVSVAHRGRLRWYATARRHELDPAAQATLDALRAAGLLVEQMLGPLGRAGIAQMCGLRWPTQQFDDARLDRLHRMSQGNAFVVGELVVASAPGASAEVLPERVVELVSRRLARLPAGHRAVIEAAAVLGEPVPAQALRGLADHGDGDGDGDAAWAAQCDHLVEAGLLRAEGARLSCGHDFVRHAAGAALGPVRRAQLHRHAALWWATQAEVDGLVVANHWQAANEPQTALAWLHHAALQHKAFGRFDDARALWRRVAGESLDAALTLRAQLEIAACSFFDDLAASKAALESVRAQLGAVTDAVQHRQLQARVLAGLVDNRVFAGDLAAAGVDAAELVPLVPGLPPTEQAEALEVLIELAMREPDIAAAWQHLGALRRVAPQRPSVLSFEGQIHWFSGNVRAAGEALRRLLERFPEHRRGLTIENDLAVMLHALGELAEAESMARSSLLSWGGVAHTETLSLLVLGLVLTSQGRHGEADVALRRALALAREQSSSGFEAEAQVRLARLALQCGRIADARAALDAAAPLLRGSPEPLRVSQWAWAEVMVASAAGGSADRTVLDRLADVAARSVHPLVQARVARVRVEQALQAGDALAAHEAARQQATVARQAGLLEPLAEALLLEACIGLRSGQGVGAGMVLAQEAEAIARAQGLVELQWRASSWLAVHGGVRGAATRARSALRQLRGAGRAGLFDATVAARREPQVRSG